MWRFYRHVVHLALSSLKKTHIVILWLPTCVSTRPFCKCGFRSSDMEDDEEKLEMTYIRLNNLRLKKNSLRKLSFEQTTKNICSYVEDGRLKILCRDNNTNIEEESDQSPYKNDKIQVLRRDLFEAIMNQKPPKQTRDLMDDFDTRLSALTQLLESISMEMEVKLVIGDGLMPFSPDSSKESNCTRVIERISERETTAKPIKSLIINIIKVLDDVDPGESEHVASEEMVNAICKLEKLEMLQTCSLKFRYSDTKIFQT
ncbi:Hypothetical predicted protein [Cloeon dipterum]|uniref:Uncharacterized protein n=1 Tax=Cloeon dipterum TaxID=197152 RepID=A0A8S1DJ43_9INSE|nr:Hypothetical predicted protein [Cloeon dipterum]